MHNCLKPKVICYSLGVYLAYTKLRVFFVETCYKAKNVYW